MCNTKVNKYQNQKQSCCSNDSLDTLAQLSTKALNPFVNAETPLQLKFQKRARAKAFTFSYLFDLIDLKSPLQKAYWSSYHCSKVILQEENKASSRYCNQRWCLVCNRIRTAKMINGYSSEIEAFKDPQFLTLTVPNVKARKLKATIEDMTKTMLKIRKNLKKTYGITLKGLRKYECTHNKQRNDYHPHFHFIIEGKEAAETTLKLWLKNYKGAERVGQDITPGNKETLKELCKYFTKIIAKDNDYNPKALDIMFRAVKGKRTFQPMGIKKDVSEDIQEIESQEIDFKPNQIEIYSYEKEANDWVSSCGELFSEYKPSKEDLKVINGDYKTTINKST